MKMKYVEIFILGFVLGAGAVAVIYYLYTKVQKKNFKNDKKEECGASENSFSGTMHEFEEDYHNVSKNIKTRHEEAAKQMRESLSNIVNTDCVEETENTAALNNILNDIGNLMD